MLRLPVCAALALCLMLLPLPLVQAEEKPAAIPTALQDYVARPDSSFAWKQVQRSERATGTVIELEMISQTWQDIVWKHPLMVYEPKTLRHTNHTLLFITGGANWARPKASDEDMGLALAALAGARVAMLHLVPNQPLFGGRVEDDLITETLLKYLETGDKSWPLLFPMVKSAVRAMDAVQQMTAKNGQPVPTGFIVTGASKRGWTTWLSAVADSRVVAIAPIVIDTLNFQKQMNYQLETWGRYSEQIDDYTRKGLVQRMADEKTQPLWAWLDPYTYRAQLGLPKLIINGTNDPYWTVDALNNYWDDLHGPKCIHYVPNAGHNLRGGQEAALATLAAFFERVATGTPLPELTWKHGTDGNQYTLSVTARPQPLAVRLWTATSETKDFRPAKWGFQPLAPRDGTMEYTATVSKPETGHIALFADMQFQSAGGAVMVLSTQLRRE